MIGVVLSMLLAVLLLVIVFGIGHSHANLHMVIAETD